jgi:hypothetical protein
MGLSEDEARREGLLALCTLPGASGEVFHAIGDNLRQLHYLLAQFGTALSLQPRMLGLHVIGGHQGLWVSGVTGATNEPTRAPSLL